MPALSASTRPSRSRWRNVPGYIDVRAGNRYVKVTPREIPILPIVVNVTPPHIAHVRTIAWIVASLAGMISTVALLPGLDGRV